MFREEGFQLKGINLQGEMRFSMMNIAADWGAGNPLLLDDFDGEIRRFENVEMPVNITQKAKL